MEEKDGGEGQQQEAGNGKSGLEGDMGKRQKLKNEWLVGAERGGKTDIEQNAGRG